MLSSLGSGGSQSSKYSKGGSKVRKRARRNKRATQLIETQKKDKAIDSESDATTANLKYLKPKLDKSQNDMTQNMSQSSGRRSLSAENLLAEGLCGLGGMAEGMAEAPNYREIAQRKNAVSMFNAYVQVLTIIAEMEPKLFNVAVKSLKKSNSFMLEPERIKRTARLYPELVPNVFYRIWKQEYEPAEREHRHEMLREARLAWKKRLRD